MNSTIVFKKSHRGCKYSFCTWATKSSFPSIFVVSWYVFSENCLTSAMALLDTTYDPKAEATNMSLSEFSLETANYLFTVQEQLLHCPEYAAVFGLSPVVMKMGNR